jgi:hypothetical protein
MWRALPVVLLVGCATKGELPKQPEAPVDGGVIKKVGEDIDIRSNKVAAAVTVVQENADKPHIVKAEAGVALTFLPIPNEGDLAIARARASKADPKEYDAAADFGRKFLEKVKADMAKANADQAEAKRVSDLKDARIKELTAEIEQVKKDASQNIWTITGAALAVMGGLACAFASVRIGIPILLAGAFCGAIPFIIDSPYFAYIAGATLVAAAGLGIWYLWDKVRDAVNKR